jgi:hypothetical protein
MEQHQKLLGTFAEIAETRLVNLKVLQLMQQLYPFFQVGMDD